MGGGSNNYSFGRGQAVAVTVDVEPFAILFNIHFPIMKITCAIIFKRDNHLSRMINKTPFTI